MQRNLSARGRECNVICRGGRGRCVRGEGSAQEFASEPPHLDLPRGDRKARWRRGAPRGGHGGGSRGGGRSARRRDVGDVIRQVVGCDLTNELQAPRQTRIGAFAVTHPSLTSTLPPAIFAVGRVELAHQSAVGLIPLPFNGLLNGGLTVATGRRSSGRVGMRRRAGSHEKAAAPVTAASTPLGRR